MNLLRQTLFLALRQAGARVRKNFDKPIRVSFKNDSSINLVTEADKAADTIIRGIILKRCPSHDLLTEESVPTHKRVALQMDH